MKSVAVQLSQISPTLKKVVGFYNEKAIFLPRIKKLGEKEKEFFADLYEVAKQITNQNTKEKLPEWTNKFFVPNERQTYDKIRILNEQIIDLQNKLLKVENENENLKAKKILFSGTGDNLENEIRNIFKELNVEVLEANFNRDDLIIKYKDKIAVVEIKGVTGSSAEKHANQLEKWVSSYYDEHEIRAKGILIVNSFRDKEIPDRTDPTFPNQMLSYAVKREHCLISSLQFLGLYYEAIKNNKKDELIESLFTTIGIYQGFENWQNYIEE